MWDVLDNLYILLGSTLLIFLVVDHYFNKNPCPYRSPIYCYGYGKFDGPHTWKDKYPVAAGKYQSPINIISACAICVPAETLPPLEYSTEYYVPPSQMMFINDGHGVCLYARWKRDQHASISGGPLEDCYEFYNVRFRWGYNDDEGSEHMIDSRKYSMEMQLTYSKPGNTSLVEAANAGDVLVISYLFQVTPVDNPYIDILLANITPLNVPFARHCIEPIPLALLAPAFTRKFYSYCGSLSFPPCTEGVKCIVHPEPLNISSKQVKKFRKTPAPYSILQSNTRPVQNINGREIIVYE